ncbi:Flp pilus assembly protein TadD [Sphingopyxis sp. OAS728]|uniref:SPOR domain-containing protein n=1 Tax=Sphingopyxis sp. OAS728 TaxID=2663823 RepID=UPI001A03A5BF|nr:SPOR domain-containing protein [Sphingopyxis sp. OAS728]MBE1526939.1 Flp pilus assembly protein TadD [Sphingopyxis sp. OAS728]
MRQAKLTAGPVRARRFAGALGVLLLGTALIGPVHALQVTPPDAATQAAMQKRTAARTLLSSALARIASNNSDTAALLDAGRASIELEDYRAALGFLVRAEQASPRDGAVKAALGSAMVHSENPTRALDYFGEAQLLGASERLFLADRGLARDLLGQQDAAQRDYQLALSITPNDELTRRYALSLGISGDADRAIAMLTPQLRAQDRGAWRLRAMILAMNGRDKEATEIVNATMPPAMAQNIMPYLVQMDRLNPAQQAAAAHFGRFPNGQLGPKRKPVQVAAASPPPSPAPVPTGKRQTTGGKRQEIASAAPTPVTAVRKPDPLPAAKPPVSAAAAPIAKSPTARPSSASTPAGRDTAEMPSLQPSPGSAIRPALSASTPISTPTPTPTPVPAASASTPAPTSAPISTPSAATPEPIGTAVDAHKGPVGPGFSIADMGRSTAAAPSPAPTPSVIEPAAPPSSAGAVARAPVSAAPLASLADIVGSIEIPAEELVQSDNAIGADTLAKLVADKRKADAAEAAKREKDSAAAKAKAEADAKAKEEAAEKKANPARIWVQVATGANAKALATDFGKFAKKSPAVFKGKSGATTEWGKTRRLLVGPFKDRKAAQDWLGDYKKAGGDGFLFNSEAGQSVDPVK